MPCGGVGHRRAARRRWPWRLRAPGPEHRLRNRPCAAPSPPRDGRDIELRETAIAGGQIGEEHDFAQALSLNGGRRDRKPAPVPAPARRRARCCRSASASRRAAAFRRRHSAERTQRGTPHGPVGRAPGGGWAQLCAMHPGCRRVKAPSSSLANCDRTAKLAAASALDLSAAASARNQPIQTRAASNWRARDQSAGQSGTVEIDFRCGLQAHDLRREQAGLNRISRGLRHWPARARSTRLCPGARLGVPRPGAAAHGCAGCRPWALVSALAISSAVKGHAFVKAAQRIGIERASGLGPFASSQPHIERRAGHQGDRTQNGWYGIGRDRHRRLGDTRQGQDQRRRIGDLAARQRTAGVSMHRPR